jgi:hypothetical protein
MSLDWDQILTSVFATVGGGGAILLVADWLIRSLVYEGLTRKTEQFKMQLKANADTQIEQVRASLAKAGMLYERQVDVLSRLHRPLMKAEVLFQSLTSRTRWTGQLSDDELSKLLGESIMESQRVYMEELLFIPQEIADLCEKFFLSFQLGLIDFCAARDSMIINGLQRVEYWINAADSAYQQLPPIRKAILLQARNLIHGQAATATE